MADGTIRGSFELNAEQPIRSLGTIRDTAMEADAAVESVGKRMDDLGRRTSRPRIELAGFDRVNAQLSELEARLDRLSHRRAIATVGTRQSLTSDLMGGGRGSLPLNNQAGGGGIPLLSSLGGVGGRLPWWALAAPLVPQLLGGAGALVGSASSATLGAGVVGLGGAGALGAGGLPTALLAKSAITNLQGLTKAQTAYNVALKEFGAQSSQAATAKRKLDMALVAAPPGAAGAARQVAGLTQDFRSATRPGYRAIYGSVAQGAASLRGAIPTVAPLINQSASVTGAAGADYVHFLTGAQSLGSFRQLTGGFAQDLPIMERSLQSITRLFMNLSVDALPFFHEANVWVNNWTRGMANSSQNTIRVQADMQKMVTSAKDWVRLLGSAGRLLKDLFAPAVSPGNSMVVDFTHTLDKWDTWLKANPDKVSKFFRDGEQGVSRIATIIGNLTKDVWQIFQAVSPILTRAEQFIKFASGLGGGNLALGGALLYGGYQGVRGALGGRGPSAGGALGSFIFGSPGFARRSAGGGGAATPMFVPGWGGGRAAAADARFLSPGVEPLAFNRTYPASQYPGAHYAMPVSQLEAEASTASKAAGAMAGFAKGAARFLAPVAGLSALLGALQPTSGGLAGHVQNAVSSATFGLVPAYVSPTDKAGQFLQGVSNLNPAAQRSLISNQIVGQLTGMRPGTISLTAAERRGMPGTPAAEGRGIAALEMARLGTLAQTATSGADLQNLQRQIGEAHVNVGLNLPPGQRAKFEAQLQQLMAGAVQQVGGSAAQAWEASFGRGLTRMSASKDVTLMLGGMQRQLHDLGPKGAKAFAGDIAQWAQQLVLGDPKLERPIARLMKGIVDDVNRANHHVGNSFKDLQAKVFYFNGQILDGSTKTWGAISNALVNPVAVAQEKQNGIWQVIQAQAQDALKMMGYTASQAKQIVTMSVAGGQAAANAGAAVTATNAGVGKGATTPLVTGAASGLPKKNERGGMIPGNGLLDTQNVGGAMAAPGEAWIANRHTMNELSSATLAKYGKTAWQMIRDEDRPHSWPMQGGRRGRTRGYTTGGGIGPVAAGAPAATYSFPFSGSGWSWSRTDQGVDFGGNSPVGAIGPYQVTYSNPSDGWYPPAPAFMVYQLTGGPDQGKYIYVAEHISNMAGVGTTGPAGQAIAQMFGGIEMGWAAGPQGHQIVQAMGADHLTAAGQDFHTFLMGLTHGQITGGNFGSGGGRAVNPIHLKAPRTGLRGVPGAVGDQAARIRARGLEQKINQVIGAGGAAPGGGGSGGGMATASWFDDPVTASGRAHIPGFAELSNPPGSLNFSAMGHLPMGELVNFYGNGWSVTIPKVDVGAGGSGLDGKIREVDFTREAAAEIPGMLAAGLMNVNWKDTGRKAFERGGALQWGGWNRRGGEFVTHGPTLFGAGEGGNKERVTVTPLHAGGGHGGRSIHVNITGPVYARDAQEVEAVAQEVAGKILDALDSVGQGTSDSALQGAQG